MSWHGYMMEERKVVEMETKSVFKSMSFLGGAAMLPGIWELVRAALEQAIASGKFDTVSFVVALLAALGVPTWLIGIIKRFFGSAEKLVLLKK